MMEDDITPVAWAGYSHLDVDDQPHSGIGGLLDEQKLWQTFYNERVIRALRKWQQDQHGETNALDQTFDRIDSIPKGR